eukprot:3506-Chlamydomonas_euryale.AAC.3
MVRKSVQGAEGAQHNSRRCGAQQEDLRCRRITCRGAPQSKSAEGMRQNKSATVPNGAQITEGARQGSKRQGYAAGLKTPGVSKHVQRARCARLPQSCEFLAVIGVCREGRDRKNSLQAPSLHPPHKQRRTHESTPAATLE